MSPPSFGFGGDYATGIISASALVVLAIHLVPYVVDAHGIKSIPGPWLAKFTDAWLGRVAAGGLRSEVIHEMHKQYGKYVPPAISKSPPLPHVTESWALTHPTGTFVRLAPNHVSIADPDALQIIYTQECLKSDFYDAFVSIRKGSFNTRDRPDHIRKPKIVSQAYSLKGILEFEAHIRLHIGELLKQWDKLAEGGNKGISGEEGDGWFGRDGWVWYDCLPCKLVPLYLRSTVAD